MARPGCSSGKASFRTRGEALRAIERIRRENAQAVAPLPSEPKRAYRCGECACWHLTKQAARA